MDRAKKPKPIQQDRVFDKWWDLDIADVNEILFEILDGKSLSLRGKAAERMRAALEKDVERMTAAGIAINPIPE